MLALTLGAVIVSAVGCSRQSAKTTSTSAQQRTRSIKEAANNTPAQNKEIAWHMIRNEYPAWNQANERQCLEQLWFRESRWNHRAVNKRTGACGIPQSYPCNKMKTMGQRYGASYRRNPWPQIAWGLAYIEKRYGSPCRAWKRFRRGGGY